MLQVLIAALLAVTLAVAGYAVVLATSHVHTEPVEPVRIEPLAALPEPQRLPRRLSSVPASARHDSTPLMVLDTPLDVEVRGLPAAFHSGGIGVIDAELGAVLSWVPLSEAVAAETGLRLRALTPRMDLRVVVAADEASARRAYWLSVDVPADRDAAALLVLDTPVQQVLAHIVTVPEKNGQLIQLRRRGDPDWMPLRSFGGRYAQSEDGAVQLVLGPGGYELAPWSDEPWDPVLLQIPGPSEITARFER